MKNYTLELTQKQAETLFVLVGNVSGCGISSPRKQTDEVYRALKRQLNTNSFDLPEYKLLSEIIHFDDYTKIKTPQQLKIEELEATINEAQKQLFDANQQLQELKG